MGIPELIELAATTVNLLSKLHEEGRTTTTAEEEQELVDVMNRQKAEEDQWAKPE